MNWTQLHLALNHLPVIGLPLVLLLLMVGWSRRSQEVLRIALWALLLLSLAAIAIKFTGDFAAEQSAARLTGVQTLVSRHEQAADQVTTLVFLLALACALALWFARKARPAKTWTLAVVLVLGLVTCLFYVRTAHSGGQIGHAELRR
jgi:hypothetical protein